VTNRLTPYPAPARPLTGPDRGPAPRPPAPVRAAHAAPPDRGDGGLESALNVAWVVLGLQLLGLLVWSAILYHRWSNTWDFALRYQAWWAIGHGHLDPYVSVAHRYFWQDHFELINWPLAPLSRIWPHALWPLWIQDLLVVGGEAGAVLLVADATRRPTWSRRVPPWLAVGLVVVLLVGNPWIYLGVSFDFHFQSVGAACFAMLACREMIRGNNRWLALWVVLCLACGDIAGSYLAAVGLGGVIAGWWQSRAHDPVTAAAGRGQRRRGAVLAVAGAAWFAFSSLIGGNQGAGLSGHYGYLTAGHKGSLGILGLGLGFALHLTRVAQHLWVARKDMWAYAESSGLLGVFTFWSVLPLLVLFEGGAGQGYSLRAIAYENFGVVLFVPPLTVMALGCIARQLHRGWVARHLPGHGTRWLRSRWVPLVLATVVVVNTVAWAVVWMPQIPAQWLRVTPAAAAALDRAEQMIPAGAEVVASQGVIGRLADRRWLYEIAGGNQQFPLKTPEVYFVIVPYQGIEVATIDTQVGVLGILADRLHAQLLLGQDGVWLFRLDRPVGSTTVRFPTHPSTVPAWGAQSATGTAVTVGPPASWHMALIGYRPGYVVYGVDWNELPGPYDVAVTLDAAVPTYVETWDTSADTLLARQVLAPTGGVRQATFSVQVTAQANSTAFGGWGPFSYTPYPPSTADRIEVRVWSGGDGRVDVYSVSLSHHPA